jgi:hypothetical protein
MKKIIPTLLVTALSFGGALSLGGAAFAANGEPVSQTTAQIVVLNEDAGSVILSDGERYIVPSTIDLDKFTSTANVSVTWQQLGDARLVVSMTRA